MSLNCPSCGASVNFQSKVSVFAVCPYCKSMLVRHDLNLESVGKMAELQEDSSPLQLGTRGKYHGQSFVVVGGLQVRWAEGFWSEWFITFDTGRSGWLAEAQGFYAISFEIEDPGFTGAANELRPGMKVKLKDREWVVDDVKAAVCAGSLGELPFDGQPSRKYTSVDLSSPGLEFGCLDFSTDGVVVYLGAYVPFEEFGFTNLRALDGW